MKKRNWINIGLLVIVLTVGFFIQRNRTYEQTRSEFQLDTIIEVSITSKEKNGESILDSLFALVERYDRELSYHKSDSRLFEINHCKDSLFTMNSDFHKILQIGAKVYEESEGLFDLTIGPLTDIWDIDNEIVPDQAAIDEAKKLVGFDKISFNNSNLIKPSDVKLNFGGIAKGFIIDKMTEFLEQKGIISGIINVGGDISLFGQEKPLRVGIQHPRKERNEIIEVISMKNGAVVTSGDYERFFIKDGKRYHHIVDPVSGYPAAQNLSVTVIASNATIADAYSTAFFLMEPAKALELAEQIDELETIIFYQEADSIKNMSSSGFIKYLN